VWSLEITIDELTMRLAQKKVDPPIIELYKREIRYSPAVIKAAMSFYEGEMPDLKVEGVAFVDLLVTYQLSAQSAFLMLVMLENEPARAKYVLESHLNVLYR
jgi:hypothetical protein